MWLLEPHTGPQIQDGPRGLGEMGEMYGPSRKGKRLRSQPRSLCAPSLPPLFSAEDQALCHSFSLLLTSLFFSFAIKTASGL